MTFQGKVRNGQIYIEGGLPFPDGTRVELDIIWQAEPGSPEWERRDEIDPETGRPPVMAKLVMRIVEWPAGYTPDADPPLTSA